MTAPMTPERTLPAILLVTGPSGAGRSTAINTLEDLGFEVIDNLPLSLLPRLLEGAHDKPLALGLDVRNRDFSSAALLDAFEDLSRRLGDKVQLLYLDSADDVLLNRYSETRRRHPLAPTGRPLDGIAAEKDLLVPIRERADVLIDTTSFSPHDLKAEVEHYFGAPAEQRLSISVQSFSYKRGLPRGLDMVLDCRFLRNPHWDEKLRQENGTNEDVVSYIAEDDRFGPFYQGSLNLLQTVLPGHVDEGRANFSVGFGCTGGKHRSVALAKKIATTLAQDGWQVSIRHRELERQGIAPEVIQQGVKA